LLPRPQDLAEEPLAHDSDGLAEELVDTCADLGDLLAQAMRL
jgi:hypothetical protein